ncbi:hypothetical protein MYU51_014447 [Penicillium brevicompactum]|uniref:uncharacterized protein n=1 Tax=Penicillium brevicompactum TaxID=5074 RepID=UPI002540C3AA|nr:uncharacterized protein N7506_007149 [Penicillium brevicompactum]KAJ5333366.1 hypothetical protein N7506_007149 [Penicillium brevicompactum]
MMFSPSNLTSSRSARIFALAIPLVIFYSFFVWNPLRLIVPSPGGHPAPTKIEEEIPGPSSQPSAKPHHAPIVGPNTSIYNIPDKVWHSAKTVDVSDKQLGWINSWTHTNPSFRAELLTDRSGEQFVHAHFQHRPDIIAVYDDLPIPILRADLLRYLIVLAEGGYWSDLDVTADRPSIDWVPSEYKKEGLNIDMIVGLEFDFSYRGPGTEVASQFCNWVFAAQPSSRNLGVIVDKVVNTLKEIAAKNGVPVSRITLEMLSDVVNVTGPKIMTIAILESLGQLLGRTVDDRDFSGIKHPKLVGDVLIMPGVSFAAAQNGFPTDQGNALVTHHYEGSWKQADAEAKERKKQAEQMSQSTS